MLTEKMKLRAVEIADSCMRSDVEVHGVQMPHRRGMYAFTDDQGLEVDRIEDAGALLKEAFEWLQMRGMAKLEKQFQVDVILLQPNAELSGVPDRSEP